MQRRHGDVLKFLSTRMVDIGIITFKPTAVKCALVHIRDERN